MFEYTPGTDLDEGQRRMNEVLKFKENKRHAEYCAKRHIPTPLQQSGSVGGTKMGREKCSCSQSAVTKSLRRLQELGVLSG